MIVDSLKYIGGFAKRLMQIADTHLHEQGIGKLIVDGIEIEPLIVSVFSIGVVRKGITVGDVEFVRVEQVIKKSSGLIETFGRLDHCALIVLTLRMGHGGN
jgi:hypothetical protein